LSGKGEIVMTKLAMVFMATLLIISTLREHKFNHPSVETYEIRPGILMMPIYSDAGEVCRIVIEKRHVSSERVDLDAEMSGIEIYQIFDELVPKAERGQPKLKLGANGNMSMVDGHTLTTIAAYENVSLQMYGKSKNTDIKGPFPGKYVAATIDWEKRGCTETHP